MNVAILFAVTIGAKPNILLLFYYLVNQLELMFFLMQMNRESQR